MSTWVLMSGSYSNYDIIGVFADEAEATAFGERLDAIEGEYDEYEIKEVPAVADLQVVELDHYERRAIILWDGEVVDERPEYIMHSVYVTDEPPNYSECDVRVWTEVRSAVYKEHPLKLGVLLWISGSDVERCRKHWNEKYAQILAEPGVWCVNVWNGKTGYRRAGDAPIDPSILNAPANAGVAPSLRSASART